MALFTSRDSTWTPERAARALDISRASTYRYFALLAQASFIEAAPGRGYALGPAIVEMDRQIRLSDPLLLAAVDAMIQLARTTGGQILLCRLYKGRVLCVHQERGTKVLPFVSYERGRPMPLYRGATSKAILAFLPIKALDELVRRDRAEITRAGLPADGAKLWQALEGVRAERRSITESEIDPGVCGVAVPMFERSRVAASLSVVMASSAIQSGELQRAARALTRAAQRIEAEIEEAASHRARPGDSK